MIKTKRIKNMIYERLSDAFQTSYPVQDDIGLCSPATNRCLRS